MMDEEFDSGDLYGFEVCLTDLDEMLARSDDAEKDKAVRYAIIKTFELTYEMAYKTMRKYLIVESSKSDEAVTFDFQDVIRLADVEGLLLHGWPEWRQYRANRGRTVHTYGGSIAAQISEEAKAFAEDARVLLSNLKKKLGINP